MQKFTQMMEPLFGKMMSDRKVNKDELTFFAGDGNRQEGNEGHKRQWREEQADEEEELKAFQPGPPEVLQVHDVSDEGPECQHPWGTKSPGDDFLTDTGGTGNKHFSQQTACYWRKFENFAFFFYLENKNSWCTFPESRCTLFLVVRIELHSILTTAESRIVILSSSAA